MAHWPSINGDLSFILTFKKNHLSQLFILEEGGSHGGNVLAGIVGIPCGS